MNKKKKCASLFSEHKTHTHRFAFSVFLPITMSSHSSPNNDGWVADSNGVVAGYTSGNVFFALTGMNYNAKTGTFIMGEGSEEHELEVEAPTGYEMQASMMRAGIVGGAGGAGGGDGGGLSDAAVGHVTVADIMKPLLAASSIEAPTGGLRREAISVKMDNWKDAIHVERASDISSSKYGELPKSGGSFPKDMLSGKSSSTFAGLVSLEYFLVGRATNSRYWSFPTPKRIE